ncbi:MAG: folylpolyglutamate synthase/dihydrofolate synthase family protein [Cyanobacteriota bacterium]|nr:folylpolyglutamate synthase/dihydrofolate synthase family protein [Cyanobacteriota bacterium]
MTSTLEKIDRTLQQFQRFGVHLGLERIERLLAQLGNPQASVPIVHVAGTNGKGSVCAYLSSILTEAGYRVGRYTSPHLVDWCERIYLDRAPIAPEDLASCLENVREATEPSDPSPTQFEVITAAAWLYFAREQVDVAVIEVGLGGRLDATNVVDRPLASILVSISREHWQRLGDTLGKIATEKAGILKPGCPAIIGQLPPEARAVVETRIEELGCPAWWVEAAQLLPTESANSLPRASYRGIEYPLPLLGDVQLLNSALAIETIQVLRERGWAISDAAIEGGMARTQWPGRLQWRQWRDRPLLLDGAHNVAAAQVLRRYADTQAQSIVWVMGMLATKDCEGILKTLLRAGDRLFLVPVRDRTSADPEQLATLAREICPNLAECRCESTLLEGLEAARASSDDLMILCGSLYLLGYFFHAEGL